MGISMIISKEEALSMLRLCEAAKGMVEYCKASCPRLDREGATRLDTLERTLTFFNSLPFSHPMADAG